MALPPDHSALLTDPHLRAMLEASGLWLWEWNPETETTHYQEGFWEQYGYTEDEVRDTFDFLDVVHSRDLRTVTKAWRAHLEGETETYESEWRLRTADGQWRWIRARGKVTERSNDGRPVRMVGTYSDITSIKLSENELVESTAELDAIFNGSRDGLALVSPDLTILRTNDAAIQILSRATGFEIAVGVPIQQIPSLSDDRPVITDIRGALAGARNIPERLILAPSLGNWIEFGYSPIYFPDGTIMGVAVTLRDVTERKRLEESRLHAMRLESMGLLAGGIAHDFNNLLSAILGNIEVAQLAQLDDDTRDVLDEARGATRRASELVRDLLAFAGKEPPVVRPTDLSALTAEMVRYARKIPGNRAKVVDDLPANLPMVEADATQLRQLALNLIVNALDATRASGSIVAVRTFAVTDPRETSPNLMLEERPAQQYVVLQVADDGPGIDIETRTRIFDPFFTTKETGHGLGLASVLGAVRSHGGTLAVESEPGAGATFTVFLPAI